MGRRGLLILGIAAAGIAAAVVFLLREAKTTEVAEAAPSTQTRSPRRDRASSATESRPQASSERPAREAPQREPGVSIKTTPDGREYVEIIRADGSRRRDFRKEARRALKQRRRLSDQGPRPIPNKNVAAVRGVMRPPVWKCMREHWEQLTRLRGVDENPAVVVYTRTSSDGSAISIPEVDAQIEAEEQLPELSRCIETALGGTTAPLASGVEQKPYEDFELGMRFRLPPGTGGR